MRRFRSYAFVLQRADAFLQRTGALGFSLLVACIGSVRSSGSVAERGEFALYETFRDIHGSERFVVGIHPFNTVASSERFVERGVLVLAILLL